MTPYFKNIHTYVRAGEFIKTAVTLSPVTRGKGPERLENPDRYANPANPEGPGRIGE